MSGLTTSLNAELLQLSNEVRRKHPEIKEAAERSIIILRTLKERPGMDISQELAKNSDFVRPFILACETKNVKLITISIGCLQRLISHRAIPESSVKTVLKTLNDIMPQGVEIQLKILQTVPPLLSNYQSLHGDLLAEALLVCFRLQDSRNVVVNNAAAATLRQLVINIFEKVQEEDTINNKDGSIKPTSTVVSVHGEGVIALRPCARDAYYLFQDLCLLTNGENPMYLKLHNLSKTFGLELIESILANHPGLFKPHPEFCSLLRERVCPLIIKNYSDKFDFPTTMRLMRIVHILLKQVMECEIFLNMFIKILEPDNLSWQRVMSMEIFRSICDDQTLLRSIYRWYDKQGHSTNIFHEMIKAFGKLAAEKPQLLGVGSHSLIGHLHQGRESLETSGMASVIGGAGQIDVHGLTISTSTMKVRCVDQLDKADPPPIPETYIYYLALVCLNSVADGLHGFILNIFSGVIQKQTENLSSESDSHPQTPTHQQTTVFGDTALQQLESHPLYKDVLLVKDMANAAWPGLLATQSFFLAANLDEELFQGVLRAYQNFTIVCGVLQLVTPRDAFLTSLCKVAVPPSVIAASLAESKAAHSGSGSSSTGESTQSVTLSDGNLSCLKILLNIAQYLGGVLGESWYLILETLQLADFILFPKYARGGSRSSRRIGSQNAASSSVTSLPSPQTAGSSSSSLQQTSSNPPTIRRTYSSGKGNFPISPNQGSFNQTNLPGIAQQTAIDNDLNILLVQIKKLFENCKYLDDNAIQAFTRALCKLNAYTSGIPLDSENSISGQDNVHMENKITKSTPLSAMRGNKDERSFAISKLHLVALINMHRLIVREPSLIWDLIISHLVKTANYVSTPQPVRAQACETIADIVLQTMSYASSEHIEIDERIQMQLLVPLSQQVNNPEKNSEDTSKGFHVEVRKMGLETLNKLLQTSGHSFTYGWSMIFDMIRSVCVITSSESGEDEMDTASVESVSIIDTASFGVSNTKTSGLVRVAFPCLQLICTDFLSLLSPVCLKQCINTLGAFGLQTDDLNISLTAVGLLWNVSDYIQTKRTELEKNEKDEKDVKEDVEEDAKKNITVEQEIDQFIQGELKHQTMNALWMLLLLQLSKICSDTRPEVRNGANQTLFRTIDMNGAVLKTQTWHTCIWKVLFPLLDSVKLASEKVVKAMQQQQLNGSVEGISSPQKESSGFMVHHSRNTADKQWDETKVLVLTGISGIFKNFIHMLVNLNDFEQAWGLLLSHLQDSCLNSSHEVAIAAIKSLNTIIQFSDNVHTEELKVKILPLWQTAWIIWERIGLGMITVSDTSLRDFEIDYNNTSTAETTNIGPTQFTQDTLTAYIVTFGDLYHIIHSKFQLDEIKRLLKVVKGILTYSKSPSYRPDYDYLTPLQEAVLDVVSRIDLNISGAPAVVLYELADYITLAFTKKQRDEEVAKKQNSKHVGLISHQKSINSTTLFEESGVVSSNKSYSSVTYIVFSKISMHKVKEMFKEFVNDQGVYSEGVFEKIIKSYGIPMKLKHSCPPSGKNVEDIELWKIATTAFLEIVKDGLIALENFGDAISDECFVNIWKQLADILHGALISNSKSPTSIEQQDTDEEFDIKFLLRLQSDVMIHMGRPRVPQSLIKDLVKTIQEGSQLYFSNVERQGVTNGYLNKLLPIPIGGSSRTKRPPEKLSEKVEGATAKIMPVARERFAYACLQCLFDLCSDNQNGEQETQQRIAEVAAPILLERCASVIRNFAADQPLLGKVPFPRVRTDEILLILEQLVKLKFRRNILNVNEGESESNLLKKQVLSGPTAHLFYLYPVICEAINLPNESVRALLKECLRIVGEELGVC